MAASGPVGCIGYDSSTASFFHRPNYQFFAPARYVEFVPGQAQPCGDLVISGGPIATTFPGARAIAREVRAGQTLWVLPGATQDRLVAAGVLAPAR